MNQNCIIFEISRIKTNDTLNCNKNSAIKPSYVNAKKSKRINKFLRDYIHRTKSGIAEQ